jgi:hypothetical protein
LDTTLSLPTRFTPTALLRAVSGYALLGLLAGAAAPWAGLEASILPVAGAGVLTTPALLVTHQYLRLKADPSLLVAELAKGALDLGEIALALTPALGLFWLTTNITPTMFLLSYLGAGTLALALTVLRLIRVERSAGGGLGQSLGIVVLAVGWAGLSALIGLRLLVPAFLTILSGGV